MALRYFQDVFTKNKLEMLPGNGTIVLETVANIHSVLKKSYALDEQRYVKIDKISSLCGEGGERRVRTE